MKGGATITKTRVSLKMMTHLWLAQDQDLLVEVSKVIDARVEGIGMIVLLEGIQEILEFGRV